MARSSTTFKKGHDVPLEWRENWSKKLKGRIISKETRQKMSISRKGHPLYGGGMTGTKHSLESRIKISKATKGRVFSKEHIQKLKEAQKGKNSHSWKGGISRLPYDFDFNNELKELIRKRDNYKCQLCGAPQEEFTKKLPIHHIDYDKQRNDSKNLVTLCVSCNSKVNYNREYWKKYFEKREGILWH